MLGAEATAPSARIAFADFTDAKTHPAPVRSLYIHIPFCAHKCHYCDFYSFVDKFDQQEAFAARLIDELAALAPLSRNAGGARVPLRTIFIGGGTPSLLRVHLWERVLRALDQVFDLSLIRAESRPAHLRAPAPLLIDSAPQAEFTIECNPESASGELFALWRSFGVGRVSLGAQSFEHHHLATLERRHNPENVSRALDLARAAGIARQSIDLIYAVPGQTLAEWERDLRRAVALGTEHISCYNLTYEPTTALTARRDAGTVTPIEDDLEADMFELAASILSAAGLARYEVSNYARPGRESRHNLAYWWQEQWLAAGPSASGHIWSTAASAGSTWRPGHRWKNRPALGQYLDFSDAGLAPITQHELPDARRAVREGLMTAMRLRDGVDHAAACAAAEHVSPGSAARLEREAANLISDELLLSSNGRWRVSPRGWLMADFIAKRLMSCVHDVP
ncbi:radical SAM family heme chaperone HemW [soil metagenome]